MKLKIHKNKTMNKEQILKKYGNEKVLFSSYYKYTFNYTGIAADGTKIFASIGGSSDDVYRIEIIANEWETLNNLQANSCTLYKDKKEIGSF